ncbi:MAG: hypothetical protein LBT92_04095 [Rickettsiales bacterium]|jgi:hypothetical protein|nr:hypothetical protein [Rickettsiales bacterium]
MSVLAWREDIPPALIDGFTLSALGHILLFFVIATAGRMRAPAKRIEENTTIIVDLDTLPLDAPIGAKTELPGPPEPAKPAQPQQPPPAQAAGENGAGGAALEQKQDQAAKQKPGFVPPVPTLPVRALSPPTQTTDEKIKNISNILSGVESLKAEPVERLPNRIKHSQPAIGEKLSISYIDAIRIKLRGCWNIDAGAKGIENMRIVIRTNLTSAGEVVSAETINLKDDPAVRAMADSARRAIFSCAPYSNLPLESYNDWKTIIFTFYPGRKLIN